MSNVGLYGRGRVYWEGRRSRGPVQPPLALQPGLAGRAPRRRGILHSFCCPSSLHRNMRCDGVCAISQPFTRVKMSQTRPLKTYLTFGPCHYACCGQVLGWALTEEYVPKRLATGRHSPSEDSLQRKSHQLVILKPS
ncbi:hypothetical protein FOZ60_010226 [Perkinsus olseni]|uniref:Uncharacterized protein n=1 Tax=Perkinsus olseni TaxID=32597 RepID=A0A7J6NFM3_PEROL|nr:hypothetical protein FOZ60_010226 [Perkinsus olseni]